MAEITLTNPEDLQKFVGCSIDLLTVQTINNDPVLILHLRHPLAEKKIKIMVSPAVYFARSPTGFLINGATPLTIATQLKLHVEDLP